MRSFIHSIQISLQPIKRWLIVITILFIAAMVYGYNSEAMHSFLQNQLQGLEEVASQIDQSKSKMFWFIFFNNSIKSILFMYAGLLFGVLPLIFIVVNGMMIGYVVKLLSNEEGGAAGFIFKGLLPHGIIEIPILLLASAYGLMLGGTVIRKLFSLNTSLRYEPVLLLKQSGVIVVFITIALFIAAFIEAYVSTYLLQL